MKNDSRGLDGQWVALIPSLSPKNTDPALEDLDPIVHEYGSRDESDKAPVMLGTLSQGNQDPVARIDEVRRKGNSLEGKFGAVDPRVEFLHGRGVFPRTSIRLKRSPGAVSLHSVGLIHQRPYNGGKVNDRTPSLDELMQEHSGTHEAIFGEAMDRPDYNRGYLSVEFYAPEIRAQIAENAISDLKKRGRWCSRFEHLGGPALFAELAGRPAFRLLSTLIETAIDNDPTSTLFSECIRYYARENDISFAEAIDAVGPPHSAPYWVAGPKPDAQGGAWGAGVSEKQRAEERRTSEIAVENRVLPKEIVDLAWKRAETNGSPFKQALLEVSGEHPEIMAAFQRANLMTGTARTSGRAKSTGDPATDMANTVAAQKNIQFSEALSQVADEYGALVVL